MLCKSVESGIAELQRDHLDFSTSAMLLLQSFLSNMAKTVPKSCLWSQSKHSPGEASCHCSSCRLCAGTRTVITILPLL